MGIYGGSVSEVEEEAEGEEEELNVVKVGVGGGGGDFWRVCERLMSRRAQSVWGCHKGPCFAIDFVGSPGHRWQCLSLNDDVQFV